MPEEGELVKARLIELDADFENPKSGGKETVVQFNPETLKVTFANQLQTPEGSGDQTGTPSQQFVGAGTTKLAVQVWFDVMALADGENTENDVRNLTKDVAYFITPQSTDDSPPKYIPPAVRFLWGSFQFDGIMESLEESLEYFSRDGRPLRAGMSFGLTQQKIKAFTGADSDAGSRPPPMMPGAADPFAPAGTKRLTSASAGTTLQTLADLAGQGRAWQDIAAAHGIENPRILTPGTQIDLNLSSQVRSLI